ncbi:HAMP domain-containing histidine kinase [Paenibacillus sp. SYP-B3998]|uniref:histidine kinase n=2 Tax=Paenibacillus sp. SYP-B3998 TaxID=2678564 RepID=A0A6G3ZRJ8_9BACL|nr:HAMP domain-containing sensor histidine kinase [Paenibacillus sp. SYP-B3998]NEW04833.1 HAMP domain-containing histidine kinase [Paenibacillus sp. SYP-B3998]
MAPTIKVKFLVGFFLIFSISLLLMNHFVVRIIETSHEKVITQDLISIKKNSNIYVKQAFLINHFTHDEMYFQQISREMVDDLQRVTSGESSAYTITGELLYASNKSKFSGVDDDDLKHAINGKTAYTIHYTNSTAQVYYSYPVVIDGKKVGILRFVKDFSFLYEQSKHMLDVIFYLTSGIFAAAFLFSYILSRNITIPIIKLSKISTEVTNGNLDIRISIKRKDEIGRLASNFSQMIDKIKLQINRIEKDRDRLIDLNHHRKQFFDNVTHELKTPLTSILGYAQMIKENRWTDEAFFDKGMNHIVNESQRLHQMVVSLLELSKETSTEEALEAIELGRLLQDVCEGMTFKAIRYKKTIVNNIQEGLFVQGSANKLRQLFINVIDNAIKYGYPHTYISVTALLVKETIQISIMNKGEEISSEDVASFFDPCYRSEKRKVIEAGSRGLGLTICKAIVEDHGGQISMTCSNEEICVSMQIPYLQAKREQG